MTQADPTRWSPLATPSQEVRILAMLGAIADGLWEHRTTLNPSLASGLGGAALFLGYLSRRPGWQEQRDRAFALLARAVDTAGSAHGHSLYGGLPGLAWCVEHLRKHVFPPQDEDPNEEADAMILELLEGPAWTGDFDLIGGLVGLGVYGLERLPEAGLSILLRVLDHLEAQAVSWGPGLAWPTPPQRLPEWQRQLNPDGYLNFGVAHGLPGILTLVAALRAHGIQPLRCDRLLEGGMATLQAHLQPPASGSYLPGWRGLHQEHPEPRPAGIAWCRGDLGASRALWQVAALTGRSDWAALGATLARHAAAWPRERSGVQDAGLCHGSAGNAHLFNRWYQATGETQYREAAQGWLTRTLAYWNPEQGFAGITAFKPGPGERTQGSPHQPSAGLLEGAAGVGLAVLCALGGPDPAWDQFMLASTPAPL